MTGKKTILIVEDEAMLAMAEKAMLEKNGYAVMVASTGEEAVSMSLGNEPVDLILMDIELGPGMDGTRAARTILLTKDIPVVFLSGHAEPTTVKKTETAISYGIVTKNSGDAVLLASIQSAFRLHDIKTEIKKREERLTRSEEKFSTIFNVNPEPMIISDFLTGTIIDVNRAFETWSGYSREEAVGHTTLDLNFWVNPEERGIIIGSFKEYTRFYDIPVRFRIKNGTIVNTLYSANDIVLNDVHYLLSHIKDVTSHMQATAALMDSEARFRALAENSLDTIMLFDREGRHLYVNPPVFRETGIRPEQFIGKTHDELGFPADICDMAHRTISQVFDTGTDTRVEFMLPSGVWIDWHAVPQLDTEGRVSAVLTTSRDITEHKQSELRIIDLVQRFEAVSEASGQVFYDYNIVKGKIVLSGSFEKVLGYPQTRVMDDIEEWRQFIHPDDRDRIVETTTIATGDKKPYDMHYRFLHGQGYYIHLNNRGFPFKSASGEITSYIGVLVDVTKEVRSFEALRESEARFRFLTENSQDMISKHDFRGRIEYVSPSCRKMTGYTPEEMLGNTAEPYVHPDDMPHASDVIRSAVRSGSDEYRMQHRLVHRNGNVIWVETVGKLIRETANPLRIKEFQCAVRDISERKRLEDAFRISEERFRSLIESAPEGICVIQEGKLTYVNPGMERLVGYTYETRIDDDDSFVHYIHHEELPHVLEKYNDFMSGKDIEQFFETALVHRDGRRIDVTFSIRWIENFDKMPAILVYITDITERLKTQEALRASAEQNRMLLRELQHRVKNSMALIASIVGLEVQGVDDPRTVEALTSVRDRVITMSDLYTLLHESEEFQEVNLADYFARILRSIRTAYLLGQTSKSLEMDAGLGPIVVPVRIASPFGLILNELVTNSCKYGRGADGSFEIRVTIRRIDGTIVLEVRDNGPGLPAGFSIEDSTGLGMQLVLALTLQLEGTVNFSTEGKTLFTVCIPVTGTGEKTPHRQENQT